MKSEQFLTYKLLSPVLKTQTTSAITTYTAQPDKFDIILMDIQMLELDGISATRMIRNKGFKTIPIVAMTANALQGDRERCLDAGMNDYMTKPVKREKVFEMINKFIINKDPS